MDFGSVQIFLGHVGPTVLEFKGFLLRSRVLWSPRKLIRSVERVLHPVKNRRRFVHHFVDKLNSSVSLSPSRSLLVLFLTRTTLRFGTIELFQFLYSCPPEPSRQPQKVSLLLCQVVCSYDLHTEHGKESDFSESITPPYSYPVTSTSPFSSLVFGTQFYSSSISLSDSDLHLHYSYPSHPIFLGSLYLDLSTSSSKLTGSSVPSFQLHPSIHRILVCLILRISDGTVPILTLQ